MINELLNTKTEEKKDLLRAPLAEGQKKLVYSLVEDKNTADDVISIVEHIIRTTDVPNKYEMIIEALTPLIQDKSKQVVRKLYIYKRRPCKKNDKCQVEDCIYIHDKEINKRKLNDDRDIKKLKSIVRPREVVLNKLDFTKHSEEDIMKYVNVFGEVETVKKLNDNKWVICFKDQDSAKSFVESSDHVLGDENIKKYFNLVEPKIKLELLALVKKQEFLINGLTKDSVQAALKKNICTIQSLLNRGSNSTLNKSTKPTQNEIQSLYYNSFVDGDN